METRSLNLPVVLPSGDECLRCIGRLQESLTRIKGVEDASVNNTRDTLFLCYDPNAVTFSRLESEAKRIGAEIVAHVDHATFALDGIDCPDCARSIERSVNEMDGVLWGGVSFAAAQAHVEFERDKVSIDALRKQMDRHGVRAVVLDRSRHTGEPLAATDRPAERKSAFSFLQKRTGQTLIALALALGGLAAQRFSSPETGIILYALAIVLGGLTTFRAALSSVHARIVDMNVLMLLAVVGAAAAGQWGEASAVVVLYGVGLSLQAGTLERTRRSIRTLMSLTPPVARVRRGSEELSIPVEKVLVGDTLSIRPGDRIPMDGEVVSGASAINEAPITGESMPVEKRIGDHIYAGTLNGQGTLDVRVTKPYRDTVLSRIAHSVEEAHSQRAPAEQMIDQFARIYTPVVFWLAVAVALVPPLLAGGEFSWWFPEWFHRGLSLLIIACPCALIISTPVAIVTAIGTASRRGVLVKGGAYLETIGTVRAVVYDKTGTLTEGMVRVEDVASFGELAGKEILGVAAAMEKNSAHLLAQAICQAVAKTPRAKQFLVSNFLELPGRGVRADVNGLTYYLGSLRLFESQRIPLIPTAVEALEEAEAAGMSSVLLGTKEGVEGIILMRDKPRPEAKAAIESLYKMGILYQAMLTGDNIRVAARVAEVAGLEEFEGNLLPEHKLQHIRYLQHRYGRVAMVGDGINDAPALAASDVGVAMGVAGSDTALEAADVALMRDDLSRLPFLIHLSRSTRNVVRQNVSISLITKAVLLVAAMTTSLPLWLAVLGDVGVALLVTLNSLRLLDGPDVDAVPMGEGDGAYQEPMLELVFINDRTSDEQPVEGYVYPVWERFAVPFNGRPIRFGRRSPNSVLPIQIADEGMSRLHGEIRLENGRPVVVDLHSTNGIRRNGRTAGALIPPERPTPLKFGDSLMIGRNTRIEVRPPGQFGVGSAGSAHREAGRAAQSQPSIPVITGVSGSGTQDLRGKARTPSGS